MAPSMTPTAHPALRAARARMAALSKNLQKCQPEVTAYGMCVNKHAEVISAGVCGAQFEALLRCVGTGKHAVGRA
eukprot:m.154352 g.154352  ORF g.154352 m.154352 type:complete len:75 (+) comp10189_c1_seq4:97-321(+)